jgi:hypothetical protein
MNLQAQKREELNWRELAVDKVIDLVLVFLGLYAAIAVQDCQDRAREKNDYRELLASFQRELAHNQSQKAALEASLGPIGATEPPDNLGPMKKPFDDFRLQADEADRLLVCTAVLLSAMERPPRDRAGAQKLAECADLLEQVEKGESPAAAAQFKPMSFSPLYREDVWQLYLANGIKVFENKDLAVRIGATYSKVKRVEQAVAEIETTINEGFMQKIGQVSASMSELEELMPAGEDPRKLKAAAPRLQEKLKALSSQIRGHKTSIAQIQAVIELKVQKLKELMMEMDKEFTEALAAIEAERKTQGG